MKKIALFLHQPYCSIQSGNGIINALGHRYSFKIFTKHELEDNFFEDVDAIAIPGGFGDADNFDHLFRYNKVKIQTFLKQGGKYLGICMGAYWAGSYYFNILDNVECVQYIKQPNTDTKRTHAKAQKVIWNGTEEKMFFYDGCAFTGTGIDKSQIWSSYPNGDPMAIIQNNIGLIGCHPESEKHWYNAYSWMRPHYHNGTHHKLLLEFAETLIK